jgi:hypothetical protein
MDVAVTQQGSGTYLFRALIVDLDLTLEASCNLSCGGGGGPTNTPSIGQPPEGEGFFIPVTGVELMTYGGMAQAARFFAFSFISLGLLFHGVTLRFKEEEE